MRRNAKTIEAAQRALAKAQADLERAYMTEMVRLATMSAKLLAAHVKRPQTDLSPLLPYVKALYLLKKHEVAAPSTAVRQK